MLRNFLRLRKIVVTFARFGLLYYLEKFPAFRKFLPRRMKEEAQLPEGLRKAFETLGPTFIKIGQILSTRIDILPNDVVEELSKLQDKVNPVSYDEIERVLREEMGKNFDKVEFIEREPVASASLAQVHRGIIDGRDVVFKIKRPGVEQQILQDLSVLQQIARILSRFREIKWTAPMEIYRQLREFLMRELNFFNEAKTMTRMKELFSREMRIIIPDVFDEYTTRNLIVMDYIEGEKITEIKDGDMVIQTIVDCWLKQIFDIGYFHADPHPGNLLYKDGKLVLLDFGLTGRLDSKTRGILSSVITAIGDRDTFYIYKAFYELGIIDSSVRALDFEVQVKNILDLYLDTPIEEIKILPVYQRVANIFRNIEARLPLNILLLGKALVQLEGICRKLKPDFVLSKHLEPYLKKMYVKNLIPFLKGKDIATLLRDSKETIHSFPRLVYFLRTFLEQGRLPLEIEYLKETIQTIEYAANTVAIGMIVAAIIVGSAFIIRTSQKLGYLGIVGFFLAGIFGIWFMYRIIRYRRF